MYCTLIVCVPTTLSLLLLRTASSLHTYSVCSNTYMYACYVSYSTHPHRPVCSKTHIVLVLTVYIVCGLADRLATVVVS